MQKNNMKKSTEIEILGHQIPKCATTSATISHQELNFTATLLDYSTLYLKLNCSVNAVQGPECTKLKS